MITDLPYSLTVDGVEYEINTDFRDVFDVFTACNANDLSPLNKQLTMIDIIFNGNIPPNIAEAVRRAVWFIDGGDVIKSDEQQTKTMDYEQDAPFLFSAVNAVAGHDIREPESHTHWWTFLGYCNEISPDSPIKHIMHIRYKIAKGEKLEDNERKYYRENRHLIDFKSKQSDYEEMCRELRKAGKR